MRKFDKELAETRGIQNLIALAKKRGHRLGWAYRIENYRNNNKKKG